MRNHEPGTIRPPVCRPLVCGFRISRLLLLVTLAVCLSSCTWGFLINESSGSLEISGSPGLVPVPYRWEFSVGDEFIPSKHLSLYQRAGDGSMTPIPLDQVDIAVNAPDNSTSVPVSADSSLALMQAGAKDVLLSYQNQSVRYTITIGGSGSGGSGSSGGSGGGFSIGMMW